MFTQNRPDHADLFSDMAAKQTPCVISLTGAGGKTSTLLWLAQLFRKAGRRVLISTTTQMFMPEPHFPVVMCRNPAKLPDSVLQQPILACFSSYYRTALENGKPIPANHKVIGFSEAVIDTLAAHPLIDVLLIEADGAKRLPLKAPGVHEPCIPLSSSCVIAVTGGQMIGQALAPENVHRWPLFSAITGAKPGETLTVEVMARLLRHPEGMFKKVPGLCRRLWLLNRYSHNESSDNAVFDSLLGSGDVDVIWQGAVQDLPAITYRYVR